MKLIVCCPYSHQNKSFTLIEVLVSVTILLTLSAISYPTLRDALIRAQVTKTQTDIVSIERALYLFKADNKAYPRTRYFGLVLSREVDKMIVLTSPVCYLSPVPFIPWYGKRCVVINSLSSQTVEKQEYRIHSNYNVLVTRSYDPAEEITIGPLPDWSIMCGGPVSINSSSMSDCWYSPTNGLLSIGGFWRDSSGTNSFNNAATR